MIVAIFAVHLHVFPFTVTFRLYDRDGNGVLDSSVGGLSLKYNLLTIPHYVIKLNHHAQIISFGNIYNQSCFWKTGSGPHHCPDDARSRLPWLGCVRTEACELCFGVCVCVCVCDICREEVKCLCVRQYIFHLNHTLLKRNPSSFGMNQLVMGQNKEGEKWIWQDHLHSVALYDSNEVMIQLHHIQVTTETH